MKDKPDLPTFKKDPEVCYTVTVWSLYMREILRRSVSRVEVGKIPDEYMVDGKVDFDGVLSQLVVAHGLDVGTDKANDVFRASMRHIVGVGETIGF